MTMPNGTTDPANVDPKASSAGDVDAGKKNDGSGTTGGQGGITEASTEELLAEIKKLRQENAAKRTKNREVQTELQQFQEWKRSQMSETDKLKADLEEAKNGAMAAWRDVFVEKYNVPAERQEFVTGATKEDVEKACKALGEGKKEEKQEGPKNSSPNLFPGSRGSAVGSKTGGKTDFDSILREQLRAR